MIQLDGNYFNFFMSWSFLIRRLLVCVRCFRYVNPNICVSKWVILSYSNGGRKPIEKKILPPWSFSATSLIVYHIFSFLLYRILWPILIWRKKKKMHISIFSVKIEYHQFWSHNGLKFQTINITNTRKPLLWINIIIWMEPVSRVSVLLG